MSKTILAIDGNSILNRAFYGVKPLTTSDGRPTNALFGFINIILKQLDAVKPDAACIAFDLKEPTFRHKQYDGYKANRKGMPDELFAQLEPSKLIAKHLGLHVLSLAGYEADDILGTCARYTEGEPDCTCFILTGDRDSFQLISDKTSVLYASNIDTILFDPAKIYEKYGVEPKLLLEVKALMGDSSDNIPGVAGIGEKTALSLIKEYKSVDGVYSALSDAPLTVGVKNKLANGKDSAYLSRTLAKIYCEVPLSISLSELSYVGFDKKPLAALLREFELKTFLTRLSLDTLPVDDSFGLFDENTDQVQIDFTDYTKIDSFPQLPNKDLYVILEENNLYLYCEKFYILPANKEILKAAFCNSNKKVVLYDSKTVALALKKHTLELQNCVFDIMLASYVANPSGKAEMSDLLIGKDTSRFSLSDPLQKNFAILPAMEAAKKELEEKIKQNGQESLYYDTELPLALTLANMEYIGFKLDTKGLKTFSLHLEERLQERQAEIYRLAGQEFNINSPKQLGEILFTALALPSFRKTKSGFSTDAETLEKLRPYHPIINELLDYRMVSKLKSTYAEGLLKLVDQNGRIHTSFKQALTQTGRLSSTEPNLQNIPIRQAEGRELRKFFIAEDENSVLIDADYSQIELRLLAAISRDTAMIETFRNGGDIHRMTASQVFGVPPEDVTSEMRKNAKAVNFGIVYGISDFSLAGDIGVSKREAADYINGYFKKYPGVERYLKETIEKAKETGFVTTIYGRRRYIPELSATKKQLQAFGERVAMNTPIQGAAADVIKLAMVNTEKALKRANLSARLILQVHDELIIEAKKEDVTAACAILKQEMEHAVTLPVPLEVDLSFGDTWYDAHS